MGLAPRFHANPEIIIAYSYAEASLNIIIRERQ
jgi:hypothetical protein